MIAGTYFITGTDTGVGKTVLTALLVRRLRARGIAARAVKPLCSGGREDAQILRAAQNGALSLDEINPWHFRAPLAPLLAARRDGVRVRRQEVVSYLHQLRAGWEILLVEGAGGLLSPLGEDFNARDLIRALRATPLVVCPNRLGAVNQALLVLAALSPGAARRAQLVLMSQSGPDLSAHSNFSLLREKLGRERAHSLPWFTEKPPFQGAPILPKVARTLDAILRCPSWSHSRH